MDIFVEVSTSQIVTPTPTIPLRLDDVAQFVSLQANDINEGEFDGNLEGDEFDEEFATLDENLIVIEEDGDDDLVFASAPIVEFNKVDPLDEDELNSWKTWESMVRYEKGKEFAVGQVFTNKASISDEVTFYSVQANQFFKVAESKPDTVTYKCGRSPSPCNWRLRATRKDPYSQAFTIVTYKGSMEYRLQPGPVNPEVLTQQETHRSKAIWDGDDKGSLRCRSHLAMHKGFLAHGFAEVHRTCNTEIQAMPQEVPPHYRNIMSNIRDNTSQSLEHVGYSHLLQQFHQPTQETQVEEQHEERGDGSTMQESTAEDDETLQVFRRRSRRTNTSMSPINEQGTPEPSKAKKIWSRLRGKKKT
ncbi:hypothetical protein KSS87_009983 [Heliosperma pusillum]|nr:hypothetical protein KSS87_009983 [Heliosperma pusillum]